MGLPGLTAPIPAMLPGQAPLAAAQVAMRPRAPPRTEMPVVRAEGTGSTEKRKAVAALQQAQGLVPGGVPAPAVASRPARQDIATPADGAQDAEGDVDFDS